MSHNFLVKIIVRASGQKKKEQKEKKEKEKKIEQLDETKQK